MSITNASIKLHLAQPSVSLAIKEIEENYNLQLFDRISRRLYVTEQGKKFYDYALHIVSLFDEMEERLKDWDQSSTLRIGTSITIGNFLMPILIQKFNELYPSTKTEIIINNSGYIEEAVLNNQLDFALIEGTPQHPNIIKEAFMEDRICFICSLENPILNIKTIKLQDLVKYPFILRERGSAGREIIEEVMKYHNLQMEIVWESISNQAVIRAISKNIGISALPFLLVEDDIKKHLICEIPLNLPALHRNYHIIYHQNKYLSKSAKDFIHICKSIKSLM
jgi:DNA-binding transcriptional LysR family regulator